MAHAHRQLALLTVLTGATTSTEARAQESVEAKSYELAATYTGDAWRNTRGGLRTGSVYLDTLHLTLGVDGEGAWGLNGLSAFAHVLHTNDARLSKRYVGDAMTVSNIDAAGAWRLYEAWINWAPVSSLSLKLGLFDLNSEFDNSDTRSLFIHSTHGVGHNLGQTGANGPSIFPVTSLGLHAAWTLTGAWRLLAVVLDGVPGDRDDPDRAGIHLSSDEGALGVVELQWASGSVSKVSLGYWSYTAGFPDVRWTDEHPLPQRHGNAGAYAAVEVDLSDEPSESGWFAFVRYGVANGRINEFDDFVGAGIRRKVIARRRDDELGLAFSWASASGETRAAGSAAGSPRDGYEAALELTYRAPISDWLTLQPDMQYIVNPGADVSLRDSLVIGLRFELSGTVLR